MSDKPPSRLRPPVTVLLGITVPPLALLSWIAFSGSQRSDYLRSRWVRAGFVIAFVSALPLLAVAGAGWLEMYPGKEPNAIGLGLLMLIGACAATILVAIGIVQVASSGRNRGPI